MVRLIRSWNVTAVMVAALAAGCSSAALPASPGPTATPGSQATASPSLPSSAAPAAPSASPDLVDLIDTLIATRHISGAVLVARDGKVVMSKGFGLADDANGTPNTPDTRFRLGSITKQFTAMAILILQARGLLSIDDRACTYLDDCPPAWKAVTIRQLLSHTAGLPDFTNLADYESTKGAPSTPAQTLTRISALPLDFEPGEGFAYSNSGYVALGMIIERVSAMTYESFLQQAIFSPLGMNDSGYDHGTDGLAVGYKSARVVADPIDMSVPYAAGGLYSTVQDLYRWDQALSSDELVPRDVVALMFEPTAPTSDFPGLAYGFGFYLKDSPLSWAWHDGGIDGFQTYYGRHPTDGLAVIVLTNREDIGGYESLDSSIASWLSAHAPDPTPSAP
jgi:CubicO group peptidase (beta-lactamase class C family)